MLRNTQPSIVVMCQPEGRTHVWPLIERSRHLLPRGQLVCAATHPSSFLICKMGFPSLGRYENYMNRAPHMLQTFVASVTEQQVWGQNKLLEI